MSFNKYDDMNYIKFYSNSMIIDYNIYFIKFLLSNHTTVTKLFINFI